MKKLIIVDNLTFYNLFFLLIYRVFGFKIIYLNSNFLHNKKSLISILDSIDIQSIDYSSFKNYDFELSFNLPYTYATEIYHKLIKENEELLLRELFDTRYQKKVEIALIDIIRKYIGNLSNLIICADYYQNDYNVYLWYQRNFIINKIKSDYKNLNNTIINLLGSSFMILNKFYNIIKSKIKNKFIVKSVPKNSKKEIKKDKASKVIFFPHKGIKTGDSYEKNFFYSNVPSSPLYQNNIEHIEYGVFAGTKEYQDIEDYYIDKGVNYRFIPKLDIKFMISSSLKFIKKTRELPLSSSHIILLTLFIYVEYYLKYLLPSKDAKLALVGYDYLFPKPLAVTLDIMRIDTVAYQERYLSAFVGLGAVSIDTYFMWSSRLKKRMDDTNLSFIGEAIPIGCVKINLFDIKSHPHIIEIKKKYKKVIIAFDYHSAQDSEDNKKIPIANWRNNFIFYRDLIKLSAIFPDIYIIIRGKNDTWCSMPIFEDIYNIIDNIDNIEVNREFDRLNVSYQLVKDADLVIGRYTSLMEESVAYGVPAISCDYGCNFQNNIEKMYDGDSCFRFVSSYDELKYQVDNIVNNKEIMDYSCVKSLYKTIEKPKELILDKLEEIL